MKRVDFHMHTTHSDGSLSPRDLMRRCREKNLTCVSVTDHDTVSSYEECREEAQSLGLELIPGIEISAQFEPGTLHILGYFLDPKNTKLVACLEEIQAARRERNPEIVNRLRKLGMEISFEEVVAEARANEKEPHEQQLGRPHFAKLLVKKGYAKSLEDAFDRFLSKGRPAYVDKRRVSSEQAIAVIRAAGGVASVAHPKQMRLAPDALEREMKNLADQGLVGIEVYNSCQGPRDHEIYRGIAKRLGLVITGGSDFHGAHKPGVEVGNLGEGAELGYEMVDSLRKRTPH